MTQSTLKHAMVRIQYAEHSSPIAVFRCPEPEKLNFVFASTVKTQQMISQGHPDFIGVYDSTMDQAKVLQELTGHVCHTELL